MNEIRDYGDNKMIVLYTDEPRVMGTLNRLKKVIKVIPYHQKERLVGADIYFNKRELKWLKNRLEKLGSGDTKYLDFS